MTIPLGVIMAAMRRKARADILRRLRSQGRHDRAVALMRIWRHTPKHRA